MNNEPLKKIVEDSYDDSKEDSYVTMVKDFFSKQMQTIHIIFWIHILFFLVLMIVCGILFLMADQTKDQIMYASFFVCCVVLCYLIKVFAWIMVSKNSTQRELKRLEIRIAELAELIKNK